MRGRFLGVAIGVTAVVALMFMGTIIETVDASEVVRIQGITGRVTWYTTPGPKFQGFGAVTRLARRGTVQFHAEESGDHRLPMRFNDNGRALIKGQVNYTIPADAAALEQLYANFPSEDAIVQRLVRPSLNKAVLLTGGLMTSYESYKEKRSMMTEFVEDQMERGVYQTRTLQREVDDEALDQNGVPIKVKKTITEVVIATTTNGERLRSETGQLAHYGVAVDGFAVEDIDYDDQVDKQIQEQQAITMSVQTSIAKAKQAVQDAVTAEAQGRANVATERAKREIEKTAAVVEGEKLRDVAKLGAEEAKYYKEQQILRADADSEYKRRILNADGALAQKLEVYKEVQGFWADAFSKFQGNIVPSVVTGSSGNAQGNAMANLMEMLGAKAAMDLGLQMSISHKPQ